MKNDTLYDRLENCLAGSIVPKRAFVGLDGFIDEIFSVVDKRLDADHYSRIETIEAYGKRILEGSGLSLNLEIVSLAQKIIYDFLKFFRKFTKSMRNYNYCFLIFIFKFIIIYFYSAFYTCMAAYYRCSVIF